MTLRKKTILVLGGITVCLIAIVFLMSRFILLRDFTKLEHSVAQENIERVLNSLYIEMDSLESTASDWASWDDTYAFVEDANTDYVNTNLVDGTFINLGLNLIVLVNSSNQIVFSKAFDLENNKAMPVPPDLMKHLPPNSPSLSSFETDNSTITGIINLSDYPILVVSKPILNSDDQGPSRGALIIGRYLDQSAIGRLSEATRLSLSTYELGHSQIPTDVEAARSSLSAGTSILVRPLDQNRIGGYALLKDVYGQPSLVLRMEMPRDIYAQGIGTIVYLVLVLTAIGFIYTITVLFYLQKTELSRMTRLSKAVTNVGKTGDLSLRVPVTGADEVSGLAKTINAMLATLQDLHEKEAQLRQELELQMGRRVEFNRALVHELKTPLTPLLTSSEMLATELKQEPFLSLAKNINKGALRLNDRIDELLDLTKGEIGMLRLNLTEIDLLYLLRDMADEMQPTASQRRQTLELDLPASLPLVKADEDRIRQIVFNLFNNASKFTPEGGKVTIRAKQTDSVLTVEVQDTGLGIAEEDQKTLFQPYHRSRTDRQKLGGLGLGLALCKTLVELHGGQIWVNSHLGEGSVFTFTLPLEFSGSKQKKFKRGS